MTTAWFEPGVAIWFSFLSLFSLLSVLGPFAERGEHRKAVVGAFKGALGLGVVFLALTGAAALAEQPGYVIVPFLVCGVVLTAVFASTLPGIHRAYQQAEHRKMAAKDL